MVDKNINGKGHHPSNTKQGNMYEMYDAPG